jgi:peptide/nickel transport system substrate-binding protein
MKRRRGIALAALGAVAALVLAACGGGGSSSTTPSNAGFNAANTGVVNPSNHKGGTLTFDNSSAPDSTDPGNTYYAYMWNFTQLYATPLMTYKACPGKCGLQLVPALATSPGIVSNNGLTWTYHIKPNVKFDDGTTVTSADVKYAVERTFDRGKFPLGPAYFTFLLAPQKPAYPGPYTDRSKNLMGLKAVTTPNPTTVVFHLAQPFADFNYVVAIPQTAPVPPNKDTGASYQLHPVSSGPFMFQSYQLNKQLTLVPNPHWNPATNPQAKQLPSKITMTMNVNANDIDSRLLAGDLNVDAAGTGVQAAARARILSTPSLKAQADNPVIPRLWYAAIGTRVPPLNNVHCRMAVEYAASKVNYQTAYGGPVAGGPIASTVSPPVLIGYKHFDLYEATTKPNGDLAKAKQELAACGQPNGFTTAISYRSDRPKEVSAAQALQASLARVGIKTSLHGFPTATYDANFAGVPKYAHAHDFGIILFGWAPDWPDGYGQFYYIVDGGAISPAGNTNLSELNDPVVNNLLAKFAGTTDDATRNSYTSQIDMQVMKDAAILPGLYAKSLLYRPSNMTNVFVQQTYGMYDYAVLGLK